MLPGDLLSAMLLARYVISAYLSRLTDSRETGLSHLLVRSFLAQSLLLPTLRLLAVCSHLRVQLDQRKFRLRLRLTQRIGVADVVRNPLEFTTHTNI